MMRRRLFGSPRGRPALDGLDQDIRDHIERETQDNIERGMAPEEARRQAMLAFGNVALAKEDTRRVWVWRSLEEAGQDLRYAARTLARNRAFATAAVATLALAIGSNTAMFSVLNAVLLRSLPYQSPEQLAMLWTEDPTRNLREGRSTLWSVEQWRSQTESFTDLAVFDSVGRTLTEADGAEQIRAAAVSPNLFSLLGVEPALGRSFSTGEAEQRQRLVLISHRFWQTRFGGSTDALGATLVVDGQPFQIIGVLPPRFRVGAFGALADVWEPVPLSKASANRPSVQGPATWNVMGRLRPAVTVDQAQAEMSAIARRLNDQLPAAERNRGITVVPLMLQMVGPESRLALWMLGGAVLCVLLIAAANVASLSLARSVARTREMAVRAALGASVGRIVRQLLTESILLGVVSGLFGTLVAWTAIRFIRDLGPIVPRLTEVSLDPRVLAWALGMSVLAGILVGLAPAMTTLRRDLRPTGEESGRSVSGGTAVRRIRRALVVAQFALAITLLVGAGLLVRSWWHVKGIDPGFKPERVLVIELTSPPAFNAPAQRADLYHRVLEEIRAVRGVESAGIIGDLFIGNPREQILTTETNNGTMSDRARFTRDEVSADFFKTFGTPLLRGRFFSVGDAFGGPPVAIINEAMARRFWPGDDPVGRKFTIGPQDSDRPWYTVVGVVADIRRQGLEREPSPQIFEALSQSAPRSVDIFIRTGTDDPLTMAKVVQAAVHRAEKRAAVFGIARLDVQLENSLAERRFQTMLLTGFSFVALVMAAIGIYGLIQYSIATRTKEIGLRMAIGAQGGDIFRMIIGEGLTLSLMGVAVGLGGAWWLGRTVSSLLFGVTPTDPWTFITVSLLLTAVATVASYFPARRAMRVDPIVALRVT
jgi:putative ABC transport system permease protein